MSVDIMEAAGPLQLCAGQIPGIESAIHDTRFVFSSDETQGSLLVDASNALKCFEYLAFVPIGDPSKGRPSDMIFTPVPVKASTASEKNSLLTTSHDLTPFGK